MAATGSKITILRWGVAWGPLSLAALLFLLAACWRLSLPGLQYDECLAAAPAVNFVRGTENAEPMQIRPSVIRPFGRPLPVMVMPYIGPVKPLLHAPLFAVFGISTVTVRWLPLLAGLASLGLTWWIGRRLATKAVADLTVVLLALDPSWVYYLTRDVGPAALAVTFKLSAVATGILWWRSRRHRDLVATAFFLGLGVSHKVDFLWVVAALVVPWLMLAGSELRSRFAGRKPWGSMALAALGFGVGAAPVVAFNLATAGATFGPFLERLLLSERGSFLAGFLPSLGTRLEQVAGLLNGDLVHRLFFRAPLDPVPLPAGDAALWLVPVLVPALATASLVGVTFLSRRVDARLGTFRLGPALGLHVAILLVASCFSPTALNPHHLLTLYPALHLAMALAAVSAAPVAGSRRWSSVRVGVLVGVVLLVNASNLAAVRSIDRGLQETGGVGFWSDTIVELAEDLDARGEPVTVMDWGFTNNLIVLTEGRLSLEPAYRELWRQAPVPKRFEPYLERHRLYLFHAPGFTLYPQVPGLFRELAASHGLEPRVEARFRQRDGREIYQVHRLVRQTAETTETTEATP